MGDIFLKTLNMSIAASWLILAVVLLRFILKKAPKWVAVLLWGIVALRLVVPFSFESALSLIPSAETFNAHNIQYETPAINSGIPAVNNAVNPVLGETFAPNSVGSINPLYIWTLVVSAIWLVGIAAMLLYAVISYVRVRRSVAERAPYKGNIFLCDHVKSPFILGLICPKIYLPSNMDATSMEPVIAHEKAHLTRRDHWWKPLGFLILTVHWFNPLCWIAYVLLCRDIELSCDEKVIRQMDLDGKKRYSTALLECNAQRRLVTICPLAFGEVGVKERVKNVLNYKKPAFWVIVVAVIACGVVTVIFATNPVKKQPPMNDLQLISADVMDFRSDPPILYSMNTSELDELSSRLKDINMTGVDDDLMGMTPYYSIKITDQKVEGFSVSGFDTDGNHVGILYQGHYYRVQDDAFSRYLQNICAGYQRADALPRLTLDDVVMLSQKGDALSWSDFEQYQGREVGSGLYIMRYEIDELFDVLVGGVPDETPMYIELRVHNEAEDHIDIRTGGVSAFIEAHRNDALKVDKLSAALNKLEYQPFTCDGLPEYKLYDTDGTVYSINFSEKWVWRGNSEQAELSDELIRLLRESGGLVVGEDTPTPAGPDAAATTLSEEQAAIRQAILKHNKSSNSQEYDVACCSFITLETLSGTPLVGSSTHKITYYGWALYNEYKVTDEGLKTVSGSHVPVALSFDLDERGYTLTEYWEPRDGSYNAPDIREKFPAHIVEDAFHSQKFVLQQTQKCYEQAISSTGLDTDKVIGSLIETICSSPTLSSNPGDYIEEHSIEYRELTYYGRYTLKYCFTEFLKGGKTDLRGHIMRAAIDDIAPEARLKLYAETGQEYFDVWKDAAMSIREQHDMEWIEAHQPAIYLLLSMLGEA